MSYLKEKFGSDLHELSVATVYFSTISLLIFWALEFYMDGFAALLLMLAAILFFFCGSDLLRSAFLFLIGISVLFQNHLVTNYSYPFAKIGREILVLLSETTGMEFHTYLQIISGKEYLDFVCLLLVCTFIFKFSTSQKSKKLPVLLAFFVLLTAVWNDIGAPVYAFRKEMSENARILENYRSFRFSAKDISRETYSTRIVVIGETHRHDYFDEYGYTEKHSPALLQAKKTGKLYDFTNVTSGFYYTTGSVPIILTRKPVECETRFYEERSLISAFKEAGYATWTISYAKKTQPEDDAMNMIFLEADEYINHYETSGTFDDVGMLPIIKKILEDKSHKKKLIVIKMVGAHYLYEERYPKEFELYKPSYKSVYNGGENAENRELLKNSYKNAVTYSATFVDKLAAMVYERPEPVLMSFMSDHGTCLYEDGASKFVGRAKGAYHIAFFLTGNDAYWDTVDYWTRQRLAHRRDLPLTQEYFFETYLSLGKVEYFDPRPTYNIAGLDFSPAKDRLVWTSIGLERYDNLMPEQSELDKAKKETRQ